MHEWVGELGPEGGTPYIDGENENVEETEKQVYKQGIHVEGNENGNENGNGNENENENNDVEQGSVVESPYLGAQ